MKKYNSVNDIKLEFLRGSYDFSQKEFMVDDVEYQFLGESTKYSMLEILVNNHKSMVVYNVVRNKENEAKEKDAELSNWIIFLWGMDDKLRLVPYDVRNTTKARASVQIKEAKTKEIDADRIIADKVNVKFIDLSVANDIVAKVDTGAQITSLHATDIDISRNGEGATVSFNAPDLSNNRFTLPMVDQQPVKTSDGRTSNRPVIKMTMKIKNKLLKDILVNLNDRSKMDDPMLLGQNALEAGNFLVDPTILKDGELFSAEFLAEVAQEQVPSSLIDKETSRKLYEVLNEAGDLSISELIIILRTEILNNLDDVSY